MNEAVYPRKPEWFEWGEWISGTGAGLGPRQEKKTLSGIWSGWYAYADGRDRVPFTAMISERDGAFSGSTLEPNTFAAGDGEELQADISGLRDGEAVDFVKRYTAGQNVHNQPILYEGETDPKLTIIRGDWSFEDDWGLLKGQFELSRMTTGGVEREERAAEAPVELAALLDGLKPKAR